MRHKGTFLARLKFFINARRQSSGRNILIQYVQGAKLGDQLDGRFFSDSGNAGDIIRAVTHQRLNVHKLLGCHAVFFLKRGTVKGDGIVIGSKKHGGCIRDQLKGITVTRKDIRLIALLLRHCGKGAENIVRLIARHLKNSGAESLHALLGIGKLRKKLGGRLVASRFIGIVKFVTEGGGLYVKGNCAIIGRKSLDLLGYDIDHTVHRIGIDALIVRQKANAIEGSVYDTVSINYKKFFHSVSLLPMFFL